VRVDKPSVYLGGEEPTCVYARQDGDAQSSRLHCLASSVLVGGGVGGAVNRGACNPGNRPDPSPKLDKGARYLARVVLQIVTSNTAGGPFLHLRKTLM
jgi:hypothetical protein